MSRNAGYAPARGGKVTVAHQRLYQTGAYPAAVIAQLPSNGAQVALSLLGKGAHPAHALKAAGYLPAVQMTGYQPHGATVGSPRDTPLVSNGPREFPMGFGLTPVAAGANVIINANPQVNYRPSRLVVPDSVAPSFMINDFKIGMRSQLVAPGALPAQSFTQEAVGTAMHLDTVNVGQFVTLDVTNVSTQTVNFAAALFGCTLNS
jgi:hypothetical protein